MASQLKKTGFSLRTTCGREKRKRKTGTGADEVPRVPGTILRNYIFLDDFVIPESSVSNFTHT